MTAPLQTTEVNVLKLTLHDELVGYLASSKSGRNVLNFTDSYKTNSTRPTLSLMTHPNFPNADNMLSDSWATNQRLHPILSNLLPEGSLRELIAQGLKTHPDNEFHILSYLGMDLPGALVAEPMEPEDVPVGLFSNHGQIKAVKFDKLRQENTFSLAGVQMKFSMKEKDGRYNLSKGTLSKNSLSKDNLSKSSTFKNNTSKNNALGDWIVKTPSTKHQDVPTNEFTAMTLASLMGVDIPDIKLVQLSQLDNLPQINLPNEKLAFAIKRFDRNADQRIHMEDFAQVLVKYPHEKYSSGNYEQIARILYQFSEEGLTDTQQLARRLVANILLANGDAHLKNWSLLYADKVTPRLSPAYDIVTTSVYMENEQHFALNLAKSKAWYGMSYEHFEYWAKKSDIPWRAIKPHLEDAMGKARNLWPIALKDLPMNEQHKQQLIQHWQRLHKDFRV